MQVPQRLWLYALATNVSSTSGDYSFQHCWEMMSRTRCTGVARSHWDGVQPWVLILYKAEPPALLCNRELLGPRFALEGYLCQWVCCCPCLPTHIRKGRYGLAESAPCTGQRIWLHRLCITVVYANLDAEWPGVQEHCRHDIVTSSMLNPREALLLCGGLNVGSLGVRVLPSTILLVTYTVNVLN